MPASNRKALQSRGDGSSSRALQCAYISPRRAATVPSMRFELHCHSTCSDGTEAPVQVAERAAARGVAVFALTDHDTCAGSSLSVAGARVLRAVEVSCD